MKALRLEPFGMGCSAAPRTELAPGVFTANEAPSFISPTSLRHLPYISPHPTTNPNPTQAPPQEPIPLHHEMAQCDVRPTYVAFHCVTPATQALNLPIPP